MLLIHTVSHEIREFVGANIPPYVILSHTWGEEEVTLQDMLTERKGEGKAGYAKILKCCEQAQRDGFTYAWIDTCCIDKKSSAELSEAINSMYEWYEKAHICYAYLADTSGSLYVDEEETVGSRWFTRAWTLQELLAPRHVEFYDRHWHEIGTKIGMTSQIRDITGIALEALFGIRSNKFFVAQVLSWAAGRQATRVEDRAYSLIGLFKINMPLLYGEGKNAFQRLQKKIIKSSNDRTILAWKGSNQERPDGSLGVTALLATSPDDFRGDHNIYVDRESPIHYQWPPIITERSVILNFPATTLPYNEKSDMTIIDIGCKRSPDTSVMIRLLGRLRIGSTLTFYDKFREENKMEQRTIQVARHPLEPPSRQPLAYQLSGVSTYNLSSDMRLHTVLRYFRDAEDEPGDPAFGFASKLQYSDHVTFHGANLSDLPQPACTELMDTHEVVLQPGVLIEDLDDSHWDDTPENRVAYTVCSITVGTESEDVCRIAIGAIHDPITRPWCVVDGPDSSVTDEEWFLGKVRNWDAGEHTPDYCMTHVTLSSGEEVKITVKLKRRVPAVEIGGGMYSVRISVRGIAGVQ